jgi:hypothetical protein
VQLAFVNGKIVLLFLATCVKHGNSIYLIHLDVLHSASANLPVPVKNKKKLNICFYCPTKHSTILIAVTGEGESSILAAVIVIVGIAKMPNLPSSCLEDKDLSEIAIFNGPRAKPNHLHGFEAQANSVFHYSWPNGSNGKSYWYISFLFFLYIFWIGHIRDLL